MWRTVAKRRGPLPDTAGDDARGMGRQWPHGLVVKVFVHQLQQRPDRALRGPGIPVEPGQPRTEGSCHRRGDQGCRKGEIDIGANAVPCPVACPEPA